MIAGRITPKAVKHITAKKGRIIVAFRLLQ
jgi:hypothetical protein